MATATYVVEIAWDGDTGTFSHASADVTTRVLSVQTLSRGRDVASQLTGHSEPGRAQIVLNNQSGDYNSFKASGPLYGSLLPGRLIQIRTTAPTAGTLWRGYITSIRPGPSVSGLDTVVIEAQGPLGHINQADINPPALANLDTGAIIATLLDRAGWYGTGQTGSFRDIDTGRTTVITFVHAKDKPGAIIRKVEETENGFLRESNNGKIVFENRTRRGQSPYTTSQATFSDSPTTTLFYNEIEQEEPIDFVFNALVTTIQTYSTGATGTLWRLASTGAEIPPDGGVRTFIATFPGPTAAVNQIGVFSWTTPTATVDYNVTSDAAGTGTNLNGNVARTVVDNVNELEIGFTNTSNKIAYMAFLQARGVPLQRDDPLIIPKRDAASEASFGKRTSPSHGGYVPTVQEGVDWADWNAAVYGDPTPRFGISISANRSTAHLTQAILRDVSDRITLIATGANANLGVASDFFIERVEHRINSDRSHTVKYLLSEAEQFSDMWVVNVSALGTTTRMHY